MMLNSATLMRNAVAAMTDAAAVMMDAVATMMDIGTKADRTRTARRPTVIKERDVAAMDAGIRHVEEITSVTHQDLLHHLPRLAKAEVEAEEAEDFLKVSVRDRTTMKLFQVNPCLRKIRRHNLNTPPWLHRPSSRLRCSSSASRRPASRITIPQLGLS